VLDLLWGGVDLLLALLSTSTETQNEMKGRLLLDVVVRKGAAVLELLAGEDQALLVGRDAFLVLNLGLDIVDSVRRLNLEGDGLARKGLHEAIHRLDLQAMPHCVRFSHLHYRKRWLAGHSWKCDKMYLLVSNWPNIDVLVFPP